MKESARPSLAERPWPRLAGLTRAVLPNAQFCHAGVCRETDRVCYVSAATDAVLRRS
jgi:hypothetical protein